MKELIKELRFKYPFINMDDINNIVEKFVNSSSEKIAYFCSKTYGNTSGVALRAFREQVSEEVRLATIAFANHKYPLENLVAYLSQTVKSTSKKLAADHRTNIFVCPGCQVDGRFVPLEHRKNTFICTHCAQNEFTSDVAKVFAEHSKSGYRCGDCLRFIPKPLEDVSVVSCPYNDCGFYGDIENLDNLRHPTARGNVEIDILDAEVTNDGGTSGSIKDMLTEPMGSLAFKSTATAHGNSSERAVKESFTENLNVLLGVIEKQIGQLHFHSNESTFLHKKLMYDAYKDIIAQYPQEMISYLVFLNRNGGLQHKIFQRYVQLLEQNLPFSFTRNGKNYTITSLLDKSIRIFDGVSFFEAEVGEKGLISNETSEMYVGSRKGSYCKPFYIGKLVNILNDAGESMMNDVKEYSFFKIVMNQNIPPGTRVTVEHYRIPPHYQMGGLVYLNRIRRKIVDNVYLQIHGTKRKPSR